MAALICSVLAFSGSLNLRRNLPLLRSTRCHLSFFSSCSLLRSPLIRRTLPSSTSTLTSSFFSPGTSALNTCASGVSFQSTRAPANAAASDSELVRGNEQDWLQRDLEDWARNETVGPGSTNSSETAAFAGARVDWKEPHVFKADVPGLKKEEVKVEVEDGNVLQISGERSEEQEEKTDTWHRVERSGGKFVRRFRLPDNARTEQISASMENGVLTVTVPKEEVKKPDVKSIQISG